MERTRRPELGSFVGAVVLLAVVCLGCGRKQVARNPLTPVRVATVELRAPAEATPYSATIEPYAQVNVAFKSGGYVTSILQVRGAEGRLRDVDQGDFVRQGQVLAEVRQSDYEDQVKQAAGQLAQAQAALANAQANFRRAQALYATGSLTQPDYDSARAQVESSQGQVTSAQAALSLARAALADSRLRAPLSGWVVTRDISTGSLAAAGTVAFTLADTRRVKAVFGVADTALSSVRLGAQERIESPAVRGGLLGRVTAIAPAADPKSRTYAVEVTIPNPGDRLRAGMIVTLELKRVARLPARLAIPLGAVVRSKTHAQGFAVFVVSGQDDEATVRQRDVTLGPTYGNRVTVRQGLRAGERVVTDGATLVRDGERVRIIP